MLDYVPGVVGFAAAIIAIIGAKKTDSSKRGFRRITPVGWIALGLAVAALTASASLTLRSQRALAFQAEQRKVLRSIAHAEVRLAVKTITQWFFLLLGDDGPDARFALIPPHAHDTGRIETARSFDIREPLPIFSPPVSWAELLQTSAERGSAQLTQALQIYAPYLEPEVLVTLSELRTSDFLVLRLRGMDDFVSMNRHVDTLRFHFVDSPHMIDRLDTGYDRFWQTVARLDTLLERDTTRLRRAISP